VQSNRYNETKIRSIAAIAITSNLARADAPGNVLLPRSKSGLAKVSVANVSQLMTVDREQLVEKVRQLDVKSMSAVDDGSRRLLAL
jgi:mRNA interferase MazF